MRPFSISHPRSHRLGALVALLAVVAVVGSASASSLGNLEHRIATSHAREGQVNAGIQADNQHIQGFQGRIDDLQARLSALQSSLDVEQGLLHRLKTSLRVARDHLASLQVQLVKDKQVLVAQVVASYESPAPDIATVILEAHGFADLLERVDDLHAISTQNAQTTTHVALARKAVGAEAKRLTALTARSERETAAVLVQRDEVAQLHLAVVDQQLLYVRARNRKSSELGALREHRSALEQQLSEIQKREIAAQNESFGLSGTSSGSLAPSGEDGFFQAPGTNYSVGEEPTLASRLNTMGKALHLHLIGISGYRSPQHSVEVGGFANDPHTRGEASDTPGVEGVPEATLNQFGLTRPFPGPAEADHIQLLGSAK
jgi:peptidoglycan hydrolase CwlO-like protein